MQRVIAWPPFDDRRPADPKCREVVVALSAPQICATRVLNVHDGDRVGRVSAVDLVDPHRDEVALARLAVVGELVADRDRDGIRAIGVVDDSDPVTAEHVSSRAPVVDVSCESEPTQECVFSVVTVQLGGEVEPGRAEVDVVVQVSRHDIDLEETEIVRGTKSFVRALLRAAATCRDCDCRVDETHPLLVSEHEDPVRLAGAGLERHDVVRERDGARVRNAGATERSADRNHRNEAPHRANVDEKRRRRLPPAPPLVPGPLRRLLEREAWLGLDRVGRARPARDEEGRDRSRSDEHCADPERGGEPVHVGRGRLVAAVVREDRG